MEGFKVEKLLNIIDVSIKDHIEAFGIEPNIIGMFWNDEVALSDNIDQAIEDGIPYDEYKLLTKEEQEAFDNGDLLF